ncbi:MAG TPA: 6-phosphogluconolactonase [Tepidisphaeraceae bacterium]|nr:6-phosphogluconolactonase [Tepidisphaeraceae bacterium]
MKHTMHNPHFKLTITSDHEASSQAALSLLADQIHRKPDLLLCLATGSSPTRLYELLVEKSQARQIPCDRLRALKLDEWNGMSMNDLRTCEWYLQEQVLRPLGIPAERYQGFQSDAPNPDGECQRIERWLQEFGPIDVCILGLGINGHLGLNEPASALQAFAHVAKLTSATLGHSMLQSSGHLPGYGLSLGMADILQSRQILLLVHGQHKAEQMRRLMTGPISCDFPASMLWMHPNVCCFCDRAAASLLAE